MRRQITCGSPAITSVPYSNVARPSGAHVISQTPGRPCTRLTRSPGSNSCPAAPATNSCNAARNSARCDRSRDAQSRRNRGSSSWVGKRLRGVVCGGRLEVRDELLGAAIPHALSVGKLLIRFTLTGLPPRRPEPRLIGINRSLDHRAQQHGSTFQRSGRQRIDQGMKLSLRHTQIVAPVQASQLTQRAPNHISRGGLQNPKRDGDLPTHSRPRESLPTNTHSAILEHLPQGPIPF